MYWSGSKHVVNGPRAGAPGNIDRRNPCGAQVICLPESGAERAGAGRSAAALSRPAAYAEAAP